MSRNTVKLTFFISILIFFITFWDHSAIRYIKIFIVLIHEIFHGIAALLTGGTLKSISIHADESGETAARVARSGLPFIVTVSAGYIGTSILGGFFLHRGFSGSFSRQSLFISSLVILITTLLFTTASGLAFKTGMVGGFLLLGLALVTESGSRIALTLFGTMLSLYSIYDLFDFTDSMQHSDAGIFSVWLLGKLGLNGAGGQSSVKILSLLVAATWSGICISVLYLSFIKTFLQSEEISPPAPNPVIDMFPGEMTPEVLDWFMAKGLDLNGNPIPVELQEELKKEG